MKRIQRKSSSFRCAVGVNPDWVVLRHPGGKNHRNKCKLSVNKWENWKGSDLSCGQQSQLERRPSTNQLLFKAKPDCRGPA